MVRAVVIFVILCAFIAGTMLALRRSARQGMPSKEVLQRATRRARELQEQEKSEE